MHSRYLNGVYLNISMVLMYTKKNKVSPVIFINECNPGNLSAEINFVKRAENTLNMVREMARKTYFFSEFFNISLIY